MHAHHLVRPATRLLHRLPRLLWCCWAAETAEGLDGCQSGPGSRTGGPADSCGRCRSAASLRGLARWLAAHLSRPLGPCPAHPQAVAFRTIPPCSKSASCSLQRTLLRISHMDVAGGVHDQGRPPASARLLVHLLSVLAVPLVQGPHGLHVQLGLALGCGIADEVAQLWPALVQMRRSSQGQPEQRQRDQSCTLKLGVRAGTAQAACGGEKAN